MNRFVKVATLALVIALCISGFASASTLAVNAGAALNGTGFGMLLTQTAVATDAYVETDHPVGEAHYLMRFWVDPTALALIEGDASTNHIRFFRLNDQQQGGDPAVRGTFLVGFFTRSAGDHQFHMIFWAKQDGGTAFTSIGNLFLGLAPRHIEVEFNAADSGTQSVVMKTIDGTTQTITRTTLNLGDADVDFADFGSFTNSNPSGILGSYKFDEFESYR